MAELPQSLQGVQDLGREVYESILSLLAEWHVPQWLATPIAGIVALIPMVGATLFLTLIGILREVIVPVSIAMIQAISELRRQGAPEFAKVAGAVMGEFLGFEVSEEQLTGGVGLEQNIKRATELGSAFHDLLTKEFGGDGQVTPESGAKAARTFSGYNMNFAAQNAIIGLMFDMLSLHEAEQVRELGVEVAENLGLGRLHRMAMRPLIDNLITKPYNRYMSARYRQDSLNQAQVVQSALSGDMDTTEAHRHLAEQGFSDPLIAILFKYYAPRLTENEAEALIATGEMTEDAAITALRRNGWTEDFARLKVKAARAVKAIAAQHRFVNEMLGLVKDRFMTTEEFALELRKTYLSEAEIQSYLNTAGTHAEHWYKHFTLSEMLYMVEHNIITEQEVDEWATSIGYNAQDRITLSLFFASKELEYEDKIRKAREAAAKKKAAADAKLKPKDPIVVDDEIDPNLV